MYPNSDDVSLCRSGHGGPIEPEDHFERCQVGSSEEDGGLTVIDAHAHYHCPICRAEWVTAPRAQVLVGA